MYYLLNRHSNAPTPRLSHKIQNCFFNTFTVLLLSALREYDPIMGLKGTNTLTCWRSVTKLPKSHGNSWKNWSQPICRRHHELKSSSLSSFDKLTLLFSHSQVNSTMIGCLSVTTLTPRPHPPASLQPSNNRERDSDSSTTFQLRKHWRFFSLALSLHLFLTLWGEDCVSDRFFLEGGVKGTQAKNEETKIANTRKTQKQWPKV